MEDILKRLRQLRAYTGLKQADFSKQIGMAGNSYSQIETGTTPLKDRHISLICLKFGVNETWLRAGEGEMFIPEAEISSGLIAYEDDGIPLTAEEGTFLLTYRKLNDSNKAVARATVDALVKAQGKEKGERRADTSKKPE